MGYVIQFVDTIAASPTVRLNLTAPGWNVREGTSFGVPELRRVAASTLLADGELYPSAAYGNRVIELVVRFDGLTDDAVAEAQQKLWRELDRPTNLLMYRPGTSAPIFFRTFRAGPDAVTWDPVSKEVRAAIPAEPFALGLKETIGPVTVYNDPATPGDDLNANPYFETNVTGWSASGGTITRSTAQFHEGVASMLLTPSGSAGTVEATTSSYTPVSPHSRYRASAWVRCAAARNVRVMAVWSNGTSETGNTGTTVAIAANTWVLIEVSATPPAGTTQARLAISMDATPPASHLLHIDEARFRLEGAGNAMAVDLTGIKGDVETPLRITIPASSDFSSGKMSLFALRRRGTPSRVPFVLQAEAMTQGVGTTIQSAAEDVSGAGGAWSRTSFTDASTQVRLSTALWPTADNPDVRGRYRVFVRVRTTNSTDVMYAQLRWGLTLITAGNAEVPVGFVDGAGAAGWKLIDLGLISFPAGGDPGVDGLTGASLPARGQRFQIEAYRQSGSGQLDWDYLLFVPADDRLGVIAWGDTGTLGEVVIDGTTETVYPQENGVVFGGGKPAAITAWPVASPGVTNRLYWLRTAGPQGLDLALSGTTPLTIEYNPRYLYARPPSS